MASWKRNRQDVEFIGADAVALSVIPGDGRVASGGGGGGILVEILEASPRMRFRRRFETRLAVRKEGGGVIRAGYPPLNGLYLGDKRRAESGLKAG